MAWTNWTGGDVIFNKILIKKSSENGLIQTVKPLITRLLGGRKSRTENRGHIEYTQGAIHKRRPHQRGEGGQPKADICGRGGGSEENADVRKLYDLSEF